MLRLAVKALIFLRDVTCPTCRLWSTLGAATEPEGAPTVQRSTDRFIGGSVEARRRRGRRRRAPPVPWHVCVVKIVYYARPRRRCSERGPFVKSCVTAAARRGRGPSSPDGPGRPRSLRIRIQIATADPRRDSTGGRGELFEFRRRRRTFTVSMTNRVTFRFRSITDFAYDEQGRTDRDRTLLIDGSMHRQPTTRRDRRAGLGPRDCRPERRPPARGCRAFDAAGSLKISNRRRMSKLNYYNASTSSRDRLVAGGGPPHRARRHFYKTNLNQKKSISKPPTLITIDVIEMNGKCTFALDGVPALAAALYHSRAARHLF
ncbi:hypothetical protein EVAR_14084_1 [Eumeta japonica]|uniref:Uncharacterized protein n=1 Tax=Eumeta variegata TaxID=151549 RepID=A0A4C1UN97_EUMVA|nr:hypothetical protein EVAR_14084_1 [Eumeta japonica]